MMSLCARAGAANMVASPTRTRSIGAYVRVITVKR
jgi:hypothetical protein